MAIDNQIVDLAVGEDWTVVRDITGVPNGVAISTAQLAVYPDMHTLVPVVSKSITASYVPDTGGITTTDTTTTLRFEFTETETGTLVVGRPYHYRIKYTTDQTPSQVKVAERGTLTPQ